MVFVTVSDIIVIVITSLICVALFISVIGNIIYYRRVKDQQQIDLDEPFGVITNMDNVFLDEEDE